MRDSTHSQDSTLACKVCGHVNVYSKRFLVREMMFGLRTKFEYSRCESCECIQLVNAPENLADYYPKEYRAHAACSTVEVKRLPLAKIRRWLRSQLVNLALRVPDWPGEKIMHYAERRLGLPSWLASSRRYLSVRSRILDVGAGTGEVLQRLAHLGFNSLHGLDPYVATSWASGGVSLHKTSLDEFNGAFDFIMMHHSFEHVPEPQATFLHLYRLMAPGGYLLIRVPLADSYASRHYGVNWVQMDAPRHLFLHTNTSLGLLAKQAGLKLLKVEYDSDAFQFWGSEQYCLDVPLEHEHSVWRSNPSRLFESHQMQEFSRMARELNDAKQGDQAAFFFRKGV